MSGSRAPGSRPDEAIDGLSFQASGAPRSVSFIRGGPIYRAFKANGLALRGMRGAMIFAMLLAAVCLVPLIVLTAIDGTLYGQNTIMPLAGDVATLTRILVSLPVLILIAPDSDMLSRSALAHFLDSGLVRPEGRPAFVQTVRGVLRLRDSMMPELALLALAFVPAILTLTAHPLAPAIEGWRLMADNRLSWAGLWLEIVVKPIWLLMVLLWVWRLSLWTLLLYRICRLDLALSAAHPDGAGGLGFLAGMQQRFSKFSFAGGVVLAGVAANEILYLGTKLRDVGPILITYIVCAVLLMCLPLLAVAPRLAALKRQGLLAYGALGTTYLTAFEAKWLPAEAASTETGASQQQALQELGGEYGTLTDLNAAYLVVQGLSIVPINKFVLAGIALPAALPMLAVAMLALGAPELFKQLLAFLG